MPLQHTSSHTLERTLTQSSDLGTSMDTATSSSLSSSLQSCRPGLKATALVVNTNSCRNAMLAAKSLLTSRCSHLTLVHCLTGDNSYSAMQAALQAVAHLLSADTAMEVTVEILIRRLAEQSVSEALSEHIASTQPDLVIIATSLAPARTSLAAMGAMAGSGTISTPPTSTTASPMKRNSATGTPPLPASPATSRQPWAQSLSLKICQDLSSVPILLVKPDPRAPLQARSAAPRPITCMVELQATSRSMLDFVMDLLSPTQDKLLLATTNAIEYDGSVKSMASRILTAFSVQASTSGFRTLQRPLRGEPGQCLPQAIREDAVNLIVTQAPRSRYLSPWMISLVQSVPASILIWPCTLERPSPTNQAATASPALRAPAMEASGSRPGTSLPQLRPRSISSDTGAEEAALVAQAAALLVAHKSTSCAGSDAPVPSSRPATPKLPDLARVGTPTKLRPCSAR